jgi:hypothetical protein
MSALVRTELLKLLWTRATWGFLAAALLLVVGRVLLLLEGVGRVGGPAPESVELTLAVLGCSGLGIFVIVLLGVVAAVVGLTSGVVVFDAEASLIRFVIGAVISGACWAWIGVGVGVLVQNQTVALLLPLVWLLVVETLLVSFGLRDLLPWTPGGATQTIAGESLPGALPVWAAVSLLAGYAATLTVGGARRVVRADVS